LVTSKLTGSGNGLLARRCCGRQVDTLLVQGNVIIMDVKKEARHGTATLDLAARFAC
jgi:hypothetical protein